MKACFSQLFLIPLLVFPIPRHSSEAILFSMFGGFLEFPCQSYLEINVFFDWLSFDLNAALEPISQNIIAGTESRLLYSSP